MVRPKVSIALCTYNGARFLREQINSMLVQTYPAHEIVVVDDCSTDETLDIVKEFASQYSFIKYSVNDHNLGFVQNFSHAISKTCGDYVALADQDDIWTEDHIELLLKNIGQNAVCVGDAIMIKSDGTNTGIKYSEIKHNYVISSDNISNAYRIVYNTNPYQGASMLIDRKWVQSFLPITSEAVFHDTYLAGCSSLTQGINAISCIITKYRMHEYQVSKPRKQSAIDDIKHLRHRIFYPHKIYMVDSVLRKAPKLSQETISFIDEFNHIRDLDRQNSRLSILKILNHHYKEIYSLDSYKWIVLRSLHFLFSL